MGCGDSAVLKEINVMLFIIFSYIFQSKSLKC